MNPPQAAKPSFDEAKKDLSLLLDAIEPISSELVLCGGFAAWLYRYTAFAGEAHGPPLLTFDIDWATPRTLPVDSVSIAKVMAEYDFVRLYVNDHNPPVMKFQHKRWGEVELASIHVEFLTPLTGKDTGQATHTVQSGLTATPLRFMDLALHRPIAVATHDVPELTTTSDMLVKIPHPANFLMHKALIAARRSTQAKTNNDLAHIFDVAVLTRPRWAEIRDRILEIEQQGAWGKWLRKARQSLLLWFESPHSDGSIAVAEVMADANPSNPITPSAVSNMMMVALRQVALLPN